MKNRPLFGTRFKTNSRTRVILWLIVSVILALCILFCLYKKLPRRTVVSNIRSYNRMAMMTGWGTVTQRFTALQNGFDQVTLVYVWGKTVNSHGVMVMTRFSNTGTMKYRLTDAEGHTLASGKINRAQAIANNCYLPISFAPIAQSKGKSYILTLTMDKNAQILGLFVTDKGRRANSLVADGKQTAAVLVAEYDYADSQLMNDVHGFLAGKNIFWSLILSIFTIVLLSLLIGLFLLSSPKIAEEEEAAESEERRKTGQE